MYALSRNATKYVDRDKRMEKIQHIEYDYLAPDTVNEIFDALQLLKHLTGKAFFKKEGIDADTDTCVQKGDALLNDPGFNFKELTILADTFENNARPAVLVKVKEAYHIFQRLVRYYAGKELIALFKKKDALSFDAAIGGFAESEERKAWKNIGGQLIPADEVAQLLTAIQTGKVKTWDEVHEFYQKNGENYNEQRRVHAFSSLMEINRWKGTDLTKAAFKELLEETLATQEWIVKNIHNSRAKDYQSAFRKMIYDNEKEMDEVIGRFDDNTFIKQQNEVWQQMKEDMESLKHRFSL